MTTKGGKNKQTSPPDLVKFHVMVQETRKLFSMNGQWGSLLFSNLCLAGGFDNFVIKNRFKQNNSSSDDIVIIVASQQQRLNGIRVAVTATALKNKLRVNS